MHRGGGPSSGPRGTPFDEQQLVARMTAGTTEERVRINMQGTGPDVAVGREFLWLALGCSVMPRSSSRFGELPRARGFPVCGPRRHDK